LQEIWRADAGRSGLHGVEWIFPGFLGQVAVSTVSGGNPASTSFRLFPKLITGARVSISSLDREIFTLMVDNFSSGLILNED
jgi:hypothetical protein